MKNTFKSTKALFLAFLLLTFACSNDDDTTVVVNLQDLQVTIDENPTNGDVIGTVQSNSTGSLTYNITSQTPNGALQINGSTGELTVADASLFDFETNPTITATVSATGAENTAMVTINVNNVNELSVQDFSATIDENPTNGDSLGTVQATGDGALSYSISSQTPVGALSIDANTGELTVADASLFDFEINPTITATISVDNSGNTQTLNATINLNNVNELSAQDFSVSIDENPANGLSIGTIQAQGDGTLTYSINSQTPAGALSINANTGELTVADASLFDFETNTTIDAEIYVTNTMSTEESFVTINLNNINELGDYNHGGIIFWLDPNDNTHGLVCALDNQMEASWGCTSTSTGATGITIGSGQTNTSTIVNAGCSTGGAAEIVSNLNLNGYNDWFLPSLLECTEIVSNYSTYIWPTIQANGGSALFNIIWTSTETSSNSAYIYTISGGNPPAISYPKSGSINILPIRAF